MRKLTHEEISARRVRPEAVPGAPRAPIIGLLDNIRSLYNVGSIFRSSDGAFIQELLLTGYTPRPPRPEIDKTALGATETVPWAYYRNPLDAVAAAREKGAKICVLEQTTRSRPYYTLTRAEFPICIIVGNELTGISPELVESADLAVEIPMFGTKQSLNAAVAFSVAVFDLVRIWQTSV